MTDKVTGLCAPATVPKQRKVKGFIYCVSGYYYGAFHCGITKYKADAHVYTAEEIQEYMTDNITWAPKTEGKWLIVYE